MAIAVPHAQLIQRNSIRQSLGPRRVARIIPKAPSSEEIIPRLNNILRTAASNFPAKNTGSGGS